jgi:phosphonopyruvate decarboxylase
MQNSGEGNATNPLVSLADQDVYSIPVLLLIGWRGEPGTKDEPQHVKQGKISTSFLEALKVPCRILPETENQVKDCLHEIFVMLKSSSAPVALMVRKGTFEPYQLQHEEQVLFEMTREEAIKEVVDNLAKSDIVVSTTGKTSRELYEYRDQIDNAHNKDFLTVGSMGHASQIALAIALAKPKRQVFCFDGDGATIMHMGALAIIGSQKIDNFKHIIFNNGSHDSVGGQPTVGFAISLIDIAKGCGYKLILQTDKRSEISNKMKQLRFTQGPVLLEIKVKRGARDNLGRPKISPKENKMNFMEFLSE